jgi:hypothetical protein
VVIVLAQGRQVDRERGHGSGFSGSPTSHDPSLIAALGWGLSAAGEPSEDLALVIGQRLTHHRQ